MKKILIMNIGTDLGGIETSLINFLSFLSSNPNCQIDLALWKKRGPMFSCIPSNITVYENIGVGSFSDLKSKRGIKKLTSFIKYLLFKFAKLFGNEYKILSKLKKQYDIAISYCHNGYSPYFIIDKVNAQKKYMWYHHGSYEKTGAKKNKDKKYYEKYDKIITVSEANKEMLKLHFPTAKVEVIPNLINYKKIITLSDERIDDFNSFNRLKLSTVGRVCREKGQVFALEVAQELKKRGIDFYWIFVGDGEDKEKCEFLLKEYELQGYCCFVGAKENPYPYMKQADIYVQPSLVESECIAVKEAMILNKKIITSNLFALKEILQNGRYGSLCGFNKEQFANKIIDLYNNRGEISTVEKIQELNQEIKEKIIDLLN